MAIAPDSKNPANPRSPPPLYRRDSDDISTIASVPANRAATPPEDDAFDSASLRSSNLVRGLSTRNHARTPSQAQTGASSDERLTSYSDGRPTTSVYSDGRPLSYVDEEMNHYSKEDKLARHSLDDQDRDDAPLVLNAAALGGKPGERQYQDLEYADPNAAPHPAAQKAGPFAKFFSGESSRYTLQQRIEDKKRGVGRQRYPFVVWTLTAAMVGVMIYELVLNNREQGSPVSFHPVINYMLGPSSSALINAGARFPPCMKLVEEVPPSYNLGCMNNTDNPVTSICTVAELCGFGGIDEADPNQWFRFILPIFLHAGIVHLLLNMFAQLTVSAQIEREMGSTGFLIVYAAAGIFGNVLGGNFSLVGIPSVGASGAIFGTVAVTWIDLLAHWKLKYRPVRQAVLMVIELAIGIAIGFIPYVDNFAHLGGMLMGVLFGMMFYPIISQTKRHRLIIWGCRIIAVPIAIVFFVVLIRNFYTSDPYAACEGCRYLSCIPTDANDHCQGTGLTTSSSS